MRALVELSDSATWLLPATNGKGPVDPKSITKQIGDRQLKFYDRSAYAKRTQRHANALVLGNEKWTPHDLRRSAATLMQQIGVMPAVIEACLNHREQNRMKRIYQRHDYAAEKREAWAKLGAKLAELMTETDMPLAANS